MNQYAPLSLAYIYNITGIGLDLFPLIFLLELNFNLFGI